MTASEIESLLRKAFTIAFRLGESRTTNLFESGKHPKKIREERWATSTEIETESNFHLRNLLSPDQSEPILLTQVAEYPKPWLVKRQ